MFLWKMSTHPFVAPERPLSSKHKTSAQYSHFTSNPAQMPYRTFRQNASYHECIKVGKRLMPLQCSPSFFPSLDVQPVSVTLCFHALFPPPVYLTHVRVHVWHIDSTEYQHLNKVHLYCFSEQSTECPWLCPCLKNLKDSAATQPWWECFFTFNRLFCHLTRPRLQNRFIKSPSMRAELPVSR